MPSVHRQPNSPYWYCAFAAGGKRQFKSSKTKDKKQAEIICRKWQNAAQKAISGHLTADAAREIIAQGVTEIMLKSGGEMPRATPRVWVARWLETTSIQSAPSTLARYRLTANRFLEYLSKTADMDLSHVNSLQIEGFRNGEAKRLSVASANTALKVIRAMFSAATKQQLITRNPADAKLVKIIDREPSVKRRPLTAAEIKRIYAKADKEWKGLILLGIYTGQRLGDIAKLTWRAIDFESGHVALTTKKTGRRVILPLAKPLRAYLETLDAPDDPDAPLLPTIASAKTAQLSNSFYDLLSDVGLNPVRSRSHKKERNGRSSRRKVNELSFHSLRHSAVTFLKAAGASDVLAREIVGHDSAAVSRSYTHLDTEDLRPAIDNLPDVTT